MVLTCFQPPQSRPQPAILTGLATVPS